MILLPNRKKRFHFKVGIQKKKENLNPLAISLHSTPYKIKRGKSELNRWTNNPTNITRSASKILEDYGTFGLIVKLF